MIVPRTRLYIMFWTFGGLILALLCLGVSGSQSLYDVQWLPCPFVDEKVHVNEEGHTETKYINREAVLQFGNVGDKPLHPTITFLVTASKVDMRRYLEGSEDTLHCEIRRYSTGGIVMRWPTAGAQDHDVWFTCTIRHTQGLFVITTFLRHTTATPAQGQVDFLQWKIVNDRDLLSTSAAMVVLTRTPSVEVGFLKEPNLHCQFAVDHKLPNATVEWRLQRHGERSKLFSYSSRTGKIDGSGVAVKAIAAGNASFKLPPTRKHSEGTYICSVMVPPLYGSHDIPLTLSEQPRVSINVGSTLSMTLGKDQKLICDAEGYYPLDVNIEWYREVSGGSPTPSFLKNVLYSSHRLHQDGTYSLSAFFYLQPGLEDSGYKYTCRVSHKSLLTPIRKSFYLIVTEPDSTMWYITVIGFIIAMLVIICYMLPQYLAGRKAAKKRF
ncbi:tapasin-related protein-like [Sinocyclocheilus rhinocerous]|uniref:Tapasin-related protein-like n=1 Tax=Sinocyclocheilus rhinocerous TaxID=307959 RepID=A0A673GBC9_9TELE|nr:PREDICTED: tapasin-related protein-like [Sinocyclocheilus rhinocerous]